MHPAFFIGGYFFIAWVLFIAANIIHPKWRKNDDAVFPCLFWPISVLIALVVVFALALYQSGTWISRQIVPDPAKDDPE